MKSILFSYPFDRCPDCNSRLKVYRIDRRTVKMPEGSFIAEHRIKICPVVGTIFRSDLLDRIVLPK